MSLTPRSVIVPIASSAGHASLIEIRADDTPPPNNDEGFDPQLAKLFGWGTLYQSGATALAAVRRLRLGSIGVGQLRVLRGQPIPGYLSIQNAAETAGLDPANSRSAELGLALALIAYGGQSQAVAIAATGQLEATAKLGQASDRDVKVEPVGLLTQKIAAITESFATRTASERVDQLNLYLPIMTAGGEITTAAHAEDLSRLRAVCDAHNCKLVVCPIATLNEAVEHLGIRGIQPTKVDRVIAGALAASIAALAAWLAWTAFVNAPLRLTFEDLVLVDGSVMPSPVRAVFDTGQGDYVMRTTCLGEQAMPTFRVGDMLVLRAAIQDRSRLADRVAGHHFLVVGVSEKSEPKVLPPASFAAELPNARSKVRDDDALSLAVAVKGPAEQTKLFLLAKRGAPFDAVRVRGHVEAAIAGKREGERINAATAALTRIAPGYIDYMFRSAEGDLTCAP